MRVALVIWQLDTYGGSIRQVLELAHYLKKLKVNVEIITYLWNREKCFPELTKTLPIYTATPIALKQILYSPASSFLVRIMGFVYNYLAQAHQAKAIKKTLIERHQLHKYDVINFHDNGVISISSSFPEVKKVWMMNDPPSFIDTFEKKASAYTSSLILSCLVKWQAFSTKHQLLHIDKITVLDRRNQKIVKKYFSTRAQIVRSGLAIKPQHKKIAIKSDTGPITILTTNIFYRHRRYEDLIGAISILAKQFDRNKLQLRIVGDPNSDLGYYNEIKKMVTQHNLESQVTFLGKVNERELETEYKNAHIFVFPNHNQTWGLSVFEAQLHGCAVIVSKSSGAHEMINNGVNGLLIPPKSPHKLASAIASLLNSHSKRQMIARNGQRLVISNLSWEKYAQQMLDHFLSN